MSEAEIWKSIDGYEGRYEVSDHGRVLSLPFERSNPLTGGVSVYPARILKTARDKSGHHHLTLQIDCVKRNHFLHHLVARAFLGPIPDGLQTLHVDDDKERNTPVNLYYGTPKNNGQDTVKHGRSRWGRRHHAVVVTEHMAKVIWEEKGKARTIDIARYHGVTSSLVSHIHHGWAWNNLTGMPNPRTEM